MNNEGKQEARHWFEDTFIQCGDDFYTKYSGPPVFTELNALNRMTEAYIEFKKPDYEVRATDLQEKDKLNGIEWHGTIVISFDAPIRYYDLADIKHQWSAWHGGPLMYSKKARRDLDKPTPYLITFGKIHGKWIVPETGFSKPQCSEMPNDK
jgi:hypothetical protein